MANGQKTLINNSDYVFNPVAKTITLSNEYDIEQVLVITNVTDQIMIYSSFDTSIGGTILGNVLTLEYDVSSMSADDALQIWVWDYNAVSLTEISGLLLAVKNLLFLMANPPYVDKTANQMRAQVTGTISTVTTVTTVTGLTNIDGLQGKTLLWNQAMSAWANACRARIS